MTINKPTWFQLERYNNTAELTITEWFVNIATRKILSRTLDNNNYEMFDEYFNKIKEFGILNENDIPLPPRYDISNTDTLFTPSVSPVTFDDILNTYYTIPDNFRCDPSQELDDILIKIGFLEFCNSPIDIYEEKMDVWPGEARIKVSMLASDEQILSDIKKFITALRKAVNTKTLKNNISSATFKRWAEMRVLPYMDLELWARNEKVNIPEHIYGNLLFPDETNIDVTERIRKTVKPLAKKLLSNELIWALEHQAGFSIL
jgi:hypothetical protein